MGGYQGEVEKIWSEAEEAVKPITLPHVIPDNILGGVYEIVVFLDGKLNEDVVGSNRN